ncbi:MAG: hypothetical protein LKI39_08985 [Bacteroides sp.]|jgi:hypothetical protein|nr:hypothetical protein [Bacteroides sp.]MCI1682675.1 hypothetical protein [Bacteroides sp.]
MKKSIILVMIAFTVSVLNLSAQEEATSCGKCCNKAKQAFEVESLFPMFITGGFHAAVGYRYDRFRIRLSVINGGHYNAEKAGINSSNEFKRFYKTSPGLFLGYYVWKELEVYTYLECHTFEIEQKSTGAKKDLFSMDYGAGIGYQFFIGKSFYVQPAFHLYLRKRKSLDFNGEEYRIPRVDLSPVIRVGYRIF